jgi:guanylate kinase
MTPSGISKLKPEDRENALIIYLNPPKDIIAERLIERSDKSDAIQRRIEADDIDFNDFKDYDIMITNPNF